MIRRMLHADSTLYSVLVNHRLALAPEPPPHGPPQPLVQSLGRSLGVADMHVSGTEGRSADLRSLMLQMSMRFAAQDAQIAELHAEVEVKCTT